MNGMINNYKMATWMLSCMYRSQNIWSKPVTFLSHKQRQKAIKINESCKYTFICQSLISLIHSDPWILSQE